MSNVEEKSKRFIPHSFSYVYVLKSLDFPNQVYVGSTSDLQARLRQHNQGDSISPKRFAPWQLYYYEVYPREKLARSREKRLKQNGNAVRELKKRIGLISL